MEYSNKQTTKMRNNGVLRRSTSTKYSVKPWEAYTPTHDGVTALKFHFICNRNFSTPPLNIYITFVL